MSDSLPYCRSKVAGTLFEILDSAAFGMFAGAMLFDVIYTKSPQVMWFKGAAWLVVFALLGAIIPRLINLVQVWIVGRARATAAAKLDFWLNLLAIVVAVINAFVHSRDAYAVVPQGMWLSVITVLLLCVSRAVQVCGKLSATEVRHG